MDTLRVRVYNVRFGDAILISVPDRNRKGKIQIRHILIDVGNVLGREGGKNDVFRPIIKNVLEVLNGRPLDLYVMTHEHLDHVQGLLCASKMEPSLKLDVKYAWLTASADDNYYRDNPNARKQRLYMQLVYKTIKSFLKTTGEPPTQLVQSLMLNNDPRSTKNCVDYLKRLAQKTLYVHHGYKNLRRTYPLHETKLEIWAPEKDTSVYYSRLLPMWMALTSKHGADAKPAIITPVPPRGVDASAFYNLVDIRRRGYVDNILAIDRAANNTSIVFYLEWRGWKLLFTGDAEHESWEKMNELNLLKPVHFLKVSHHGSQTGLPRAELLDKILPETPPDNRSRLALVSTYPNTYPGIPDKELIEEELAPRCAVKYVEKGTVPEGEYLDVPFEA